MEQARVLSVGHGVIKPLVGSCDWAKAYIAERDRARRAFDTQKTTNAPDQCDATAHRLIELMVVFGTRS